MPSVSLILLDEVEKGIGCVQHSCAVLDDGSPDRWTGPHVDLRNTYRDDSTWIAQIPGTMRPDDKSGGIHANEAG